MRVHIPKIETTMEEDLIAIGLGELVEGYEPEQDVEQEVAPKQNKDRNNVQEALERFHNKLNR